MTVVSDSYRARAFSAFIDWWTKVSPLLIGGLWIYFALVCLGRGETMGLFLAFYGMLWWALMESDIRDLRHDMRRALTGWNATVAELEKWRPVAVAGRPVIDGCRHEWPFHDPQPAKWTCSCGTVIYRSYEDYVDD